MYFENLLSENKHLFHESRTSIILQNQWELLKELQLLKDQTKDLVETDNSFQITFGELVDRLDDDKIIGHVFPNDEHDKS